MPNSKFSLIARVQFAEKTVWDEFAELAQKYEPVDLGLGTPDFLPPKIITDAVAELAKSTDASLYQYPRPNGHIRFVKILAKLYSQLLGREIKWESEILATLGASHALFCTILGMIDAGDEVIIIEPFFDAYIPLIQMAGGIPKFVSLKPKRSNKELPSSADWVLDPQELSEIFSEKTKAIIVNTPNNPLGKVFDLSELTAIADLCKKWNVLCIADEVYEWMVYKPKEHIRIASLPGMWERTITVGSAGKTFGSTGWKVGWLYGDSELIKGPQVMHHNSAFTGSTPIQEVVAIILEKEVPRLGQPNSYFATLQRELKSKRDFLVNKLLEVNLIPTIPDGGFLLVANWSKLEPTVNLSTETDEYKDICFAKWMTKNIGLQGIPTSSFFTDENKRLVEYFIRLCFNKKQENLEKAAALLKKF